MEAGKPRISFSRSSTCFTRRPGNEVSTSMTRRSRVQSSTTFGHRPPDRTPTRRRRSPSTSSGSALFAPAAACARQRQCVYWPVTPPVAATRESGDSRSDASVRRWRTSDSQHFVVNSAARFVIEQRARNPCQPTDGGTSGGRLDAAMGAKRARSSWSRARLSFSIWVSVSANGARNRHRTRNPPDIIHPQKFAVVAVCAL